MNQIRVNLITFCWSLDYVWPNICQPQLPPPLPQGHLVNDLAQDINFINWGVKWLTGNESVRGWKVTGHKILYPFQPYCSIYTPEWLLLEWLLFLHVSTIYKAIAINIWKTKGQGSWRALQV